MTKNQSVELRNEFQGLGIPALTVLAILYSVFLVAWAFLPFMVEFDEPMPLVAKLIGAGIMAFIGISLGRLAIFLLEDQVKYFTLSIELSDSIEVRWLTRRRTYTYEQVELFAFHKHAGSLDNWGLFRFSEIDLIVKFRDDSTAQLTILPSQRDDLLQFLRSKGFRITTESPD